MRSLERVLRRAALPFRMTEGFHPTPRLVVALSLPLGVVGHAEAAELELNEPIEPDEVLRRLRAQSPPGVEFLSARRIPLNITARPRRATYRIATPQDMHSTLPSRCAEFLAAKEVWAERDRPKPRTVNIRPYVESLTWNEDSLIARVWLTQEGSARAEEIAVAVGLCDPPLIERLELELLDEVPPEEAARTPKIEPQTRPLFRNVLIDRTSAAPRETWGATANGPIVE
jgi:radical SAM-linked protein